MLDLELIYRIINLLPMPVWVLLVFAPGARLTRQWVFSLRIHALLALIYGLLFCWAITKGPAPAPDAFSTLSGLTSLFSSSLGVLVAWQHFLVFDLFVGTWIARHAQQQNPNPSLIRRGILGGILMMSLMAGPIGFLLYFLFYYRSENQLNDV
ncbi:MAG: hypothetical protein CMN34_02500 [Saprospirales bacterium]|nr:hypothetical protein [Saprospirales bacterium]|tara:strand:+ start:5968 stop:6426 length:459 start_codon:yes stop_codon:yes gene_type:complete